jgi:DegV family protein with EDD domain
MSKIAILTDTSAYLPDDLLQQYDIHVIPLIVIFGEETLLDVVDIDISEFHRRLSEGPVHPSTTQPNPEDFIAIFDKLAEDYDGIVAIHLSSDLSGTINSALVAAEQFDRVPVRVIDSRSTTMGLGQAVLEAAKAASAGKSIDEVEQAARDVCEKVKVLFVVDTLEYLHKGGRIGGASRFLGTALGLKPLLHINDGRVDGLEKVRTKRKAVERMLELAGEYSNGEPVNISVLHAAVPEEAEALKATVMERFECKDLHITDLSPAIATHAGPGTLGIAICPE